MTKVQIMYSDLIHFVTECQRDGENSHTRFQRSLVRIYGIINV